MDAEQSFSSLPSDIKKEILSLAVFGSVKQALWLQATSKSFKDLVWNAIIQFSDVTLRDRSCTKKLFERMDKSTIKYLEIAPMPPSPKNADFELNLADFPALEYLSMDTQEFMPLMNNPRLKEAFMNHKTLTSVKCTWACKLDKNLVSEITRTKKLLLKDVEPDQFEGSPTLSFVPRDGPVRFGPAIGGFDGAPTVGCATKNFVLVGTDNGAVSVLKAVNEQLTLKYVVKAHQGRIHDMHSHQNFPKGNVFIASEDGSVSLWDTGNNFDEPRATVKLNEPIFHVVGALIRRTDIFILAAGKHTAYFIDTQKDDEKEAVRSVAIGADIIRLEDLSQVAKKGFAVYTREQIHHFSESGEKIGSFKANYPSTFFGNSELHIIPHADSVEVRVVSASKRLFYEEFVQNLQRTYEARPRTCGFLDNFKLVLLSTGYGVEALDVLRNRVAFSLGLPVTKKEIESKNYKHVVNIFVQGDAWFVIGSDGKLYSWKFVNMEQYLYEHILLENFEFF